MEEHMENTKMQGCQVVIELLNYFHYKLVIY